MRYKFLFLVFLILILLCVPSAYCKDWLKIKDKHFVVYYNFKEDTSNARRVLRKAEEYYNKIAYRIGYARYTNFWTWDERVKIIIFPDQKTFVKNTNQPVWSRGYSDSHSSLFKSRIIVTFRQEGGFLVGLLPHEIGHLILRDFIGFDKHVPAWFDEGVAQLQDKGRKEIGDRIAKSLVKRDQNIPFSTLFYLNIRKEEDPKVVEIFYAQSVSVVNFLIKKYGGSAFVNLCRNLKEGKSMTDALRLSYAPSMQTIGDLERKWIQYMKR